MSAEHAVSCPRAPLWWAHCLTSDRPRSGWPEQDRRCPQRVVGMREPAVWLELIQSRGSLAACAQTGVQSQPCPFPRGAAGPTQSFRAEGISLMRWQRHAWHLARSLAQKWGHIHIC